MKKILTALIIFSSVSMMYSFPFTFFQRDSRPQFYKGIYLNYYSVKHKDRLTKFIDEAGRSTVNVFVIDVQPAKDNKCQLPVEHIQMIKDAGIHPVARIVCFDQGLKTLPITEAKRESIYALAESAAEKGFAEIQLDYIRFADTAYTVHHGEQVRLAPQVKYAFIQDFIRGARERVKDYDVAISADIFGRIPWVPKTRHDVIGQSMETFDEVVDVICPMAYPSHYWSENGVNYRNTPYETVYITSKKAKERAQKAKIVSYIQSFQLKIQGSGLSYAEYIEKQIDAVHDAEISGFIMWNARQDYKVPFEVLTKYYAERR